MRDMVLQIVIKWEDTSSKERAVCCGHHEVTQVVKKCETSFGDICRLSSLGSNSITTSRTETETSGNIATSPTRSIQNFSDLFILHRPELINRALCLSHSHSPQHRNIWGDCSVNGNSSTREGAIADTGHILTLQMKQDGWQQVLFLTKSGLRNVIVCLRTTARP